MKNEKEIVGFHFQEIPLEEAVNAVIAGDGHYAEIKSKLLDVLPKLESQKAFAFGLPNGREVPEDQRRGICMSINMTLKKAKIGWRVTYSGTRKLFICVPRSTPRTYEKSTKHDSPAKEPESKFQPIPEQLKKKVFELREKQGLSPAKIATQLGIRNNTAEYLCYSELPKLRGGKQ